MQAILLQWKFTRGNHTAEELIKVMLSSTQNSSYDVFNKSIVFLYEIIEQESNLQASSPLHGSAMNLNYSTMGSAWSSRRRNKSSRFLFSAPEILDRLVE